MRAALTCLFLLSLPLASQAADPHAEAAALIDQAQAELRALDDLIDDADSRAVQKELHNKADRIEALLDRLEAGQRGGVGMAVSASGASMGVTMGPMGMQVVVTETAEPTAAPPPPEGDAPPVACSLDRLRSILASVEGENFSGSKLRVLRSAATEHWFTAAQAAEVLGGFDFGSDQVEAGAILFPRVVDPQNWYLVYEVFDFDSDKDKLRKRVGR